MSAIGTGYDLSAGTYSPDGRLFQVEYAAKAAERSGTAIGLRLKDTVVLAVEKLYSNVMLEPTSNSYIYNVDKHVGMTFAGIFADGRQALAVSRGECRSYKDEFDDAIPGKVFSERMASYFNAYTLYSHLRPFGISVIYSTCHPVEGPRLYLLEPAGIAYGYYGCSIGKAARQARTEIEKLKLDQMSVDDAIDTAARILLKGHDEVKDKLYKIEISVIGPSTKNVHTILSDERVNAAVDKARRDIAAEEA